MRSPLLAFLPGHCTIGEASLQSDEGLASGGKLCSHLDNALVPAPRT